ncbi:CocE/NonD family hydrolase [Kibdelosporangium persicum]
MAGPAGAAPSVEIRDGVSQPVFSYADAIRETVYVEAPVDGDRDGRNDRIVADVIRPAETAQGLKVPVIFQASPYFGPDLTAGARSEDPRGRYRARSLDSEFKDLEDDGTPTRFPEYYDNYFVPRGYAVVQVDSPGTRYSEGCTTVDGKAEVLAVKAVLDWLDGRGKATDKAGQAVSADWDTNRVGWVGRSHRGIFGNLVSTMDVPNLKTIVPIATLGSWYPYMRNQGLPRFQDYARWTAVTDGNTSRLGTTRCKAVHDELAAASDDTHGTYNAFWRERDYVPAAGKVKASVYMVHGLNDWNVTTDLALDWWKALGTANIPRKLMLTQQAHVDPIDAHRERWLPKIHQWMDHWLLGVQNGIMNEPPVELERSANQWEAHTAWPAPNTTPRTLWLGPTLSETRPSPSVVQFEEKYSQLQRDMANPDVSNFNRAQFISRPLTQATRFSGVAEVNLRAKASVSGTPLTALLVDYGTDARNVTDEDDYLSGLVSAPGSDCLGQGTAVDTGCYSRHTQDVQTRPFEIVTTVQIDTENRRTLEFDEPVQPEKYYTYNLKLKPEDYVFKPGHRIGVVIAGTNCTGTEVPGTNWCANEPAAGQEPWGRTLFEIDTANSFLTLPVVASP